MMLALLSYFHTDTALTYALHLITAKLNDHMFQSEHGVTQGA